VLAGTGVLQAEETESRTFKVKPGGTLTVDTERGSIEVVAKGKKEVTVEVSKRLSRGWSGDDDLDKFVVEYEQNGNDVIVTGKFLDSHGWGFRNHRVGIRYRITVPEEYNLDIETSGGSINVSDLKGFANVRTSGGSLDLGEIDGPVNARTSGGSVSLEGSSGSADLRTSGGGITVGNVGGRLEARTSGGPIHVQEVMGAVNAETSGGSITAKIVKQPEQDCSLETSGGSITVYLAEDIAVNLDASTSGGGLWSDVSISTKGRIHPSSMRGTINGGGPELYLHTSGGNIKIYTN
ncbi:MAG: DUF4097 family beta strand repeat-containing protein, partial [Candidatus Neomarinimicrobiota bacterium]